MPESVYTLTDRTAPSRRIGLRDLLAPMEPEEFLDRHFDRKPLYLAGQHDRFDGVFSWDRAAALLDMTMLWTGSTLRVVLDGKVLSSNAYCTPQADRSGAAVSQPDPARVQELIRRGATISLHAVETMTPEIAAIAAALQCSLGGEVVCNIYCSWKGHQGFPSHFDFHDVFVLQIEGTKVWNIYERQFEQAANVEGFRSDSFSDDENAKARGPVQLEARMTPGDVLYIPRGQYHDALATSDASMHLTFGVEFLSGFYFLNAIARGLQQEPFFRQALPRFDRPDAHRAHLLKLAETLHAYMLNPDLVRGIRQQQRRRVFAHCFPAYSLPSATPPQVFRVRSFRTRITRHGAAGRIERPGGNHDLDAGESALAEWLLPQDFFTADEAAAAHGRNVPVVAALERFKAIGLIEEI
jgi:ribosomal protein L16 Arg81 hydroxylase